MALGAAVALCLAAPATAAAQQRWPADRDQGTWSAPAQRGTPPAGRGFAFERGYQEGYREGERDARQSRPFDPRRHDAYEDGDRGYNRGMGDRGRYRDEFRRGFEEGYRSGFERVRGVDDSRRRGNQGRLGDRGRPGTDRRGSVNEPAQARGYADGFEKGREDWDDRDRYDPMRHRDYREADNGYHGRYGSRDAYKQNYREGFRQGYEDGYRGGGRDRRR